MEFPKDLGLSSPWNQESAWGKVLNIQILTTWIDRKRACEARRANCGARRLKPDVWRPTPDARRPTPDVRRRTRDARRATRDATRERRAKRIMSVAPHARRSRAGPEAWWWTSSTTTATRGAAPRGRSRCGDSHEPALDKRGLEYGVRAPIFSGDLREQTGENGFPRIPTGSLFLFLQKSPKISGNLWDIPLWRFPRAGPRLRAKRSAAWRSLAQPGAAWRSLAQPGAAWRSLAQRSAAQCSLALYRFYVWFVLWYVSNTWRVEQLTRILDLCPKVSYFGVLDNMCVCMCIYIYIYIYIYI